MEKITQSGTSMWGPREVERSTWLFQDVQWYQVMTSSIFLVSIQLRVLA